HGAEPVVGRALRPVVARVQEVDEHAEADGEGEGEGDRLPERGPQPGRRAALGVGDTAHGAHPATTIPAGTRPSCSAISSSSRPVVSGMYRHTSQTAGSCRSMRKVMVSPTLPIAPVAWSPRMPT